MVFGVSTRLGDNLSCAGRKLFMALGVHIDLMTVLADLADHGINSKTPRYFPSNPETKIMWEAMGIELPPIGDLLMSGSRKLIHALKEQRKPCHEDTQLLQYGHFQGQYT
jgi:hypothetical protein